MHVVALQRVRYERRQSYWFETVFSRPLGEALRKFRLQCRRLKRFEGAFQIVFSRPFGEALGKFSLDPLI